MSVYDLGDLGACASRVSVPAPTPHPHPPPHLSLLWSIPFHSWMCGFLPAVGFPTPTTPTTTLLHFLVCSLCFGTTSHVLVCSVSVGTTSAPPATSRRAAAAVVPRIPCPRDVVIYWCGPATSILRLPPAPLSPYFFPFEVPVIVSSGLRLCHMRVDLPSRRPRDGLLSCA